MLSSACWLGLARDANFFRIGMSSYGFASRPELLMLEGEEKRSGAEGPAVSSMNRNGPGTARRREQLGMYLVARRRDVS